MRKRTLIPLAIALATLAGFGIMFYLRAQAPPEAARLLPESDAIVYVHLKTLRNTTHLFDAHTPAPVSPDLQHFIDATGIVPERDIDSAAFALHKVPVLLPGPHPRHAADLFSSEVFIGRFDGERLARFLTAAATARETYAGRTVYSVPLDGQTLRVAQLAYDTIAASNMPTPEQIHSMLDRSRASALGTPGCSLLAAHFHDVPLLSEAWGIGHIGLPFSQNGNISVMGLQLPLPEDSDLVASLRYTPTEHMLSGGAVHLRIEDFAPNTSAAQNTVETLSALLGLLRGIGGAASPQTPSDQALRQILASIQIVQHNQRAFLNATATVDELKSIFTSQSSDLVLPASADGLTPAASTMR